MSIKLKNVPIMLSFMLLMVGTITAIMTLINLQPSQSFLNTWVDTFTFAFLVMLPVGGAIFITISKCINQFFSTWSSLQKNLLQGILMAVIMESLMAVVSILNSHSYESITEFSGYFLNTLLYALPVGLALSCFMSLVVKPKLEKHLTKVSA
ncbi:DUF2798 domain-containing protein [Colwellia sp. RE-S-Sl-9]